MANEKITTYERPTQEIHSSNDERPLTFNDFSSFPLDILNLYGLIETVTAVPAGKPVKFYDQFKLYTDSLTSPSIYRLYVYMVGLNAWHYCALT